jgi:hypothetical protein
MKGTNATTSHNASSGIPEGEKGKSKFEPFVNPSKATNEDVPESSAQAARRESIGKIPYCFRCKTKAHVIEDCLIVMLKCFARYVKAEIIASLVAQNSEQIKWLLSHVGMLWRVWVFSTLLMMLR